MFIKKDTRKLTEMLTDESDPKERLILSRRKDFFRGHVKLLCQARYMPKLPKLHTLSLYDNGISDASGIGVFSALPTLRELNLGRNELTQLPAEFATLRALRVLWLEDNKLAAFPPPLLELTELEQLRLSGNIITVLPPQIAKLGALEVLAADTNLLTEVPRELCTLGRLRTLLLRGNPLEALPKEIGQLTKLEFLSVNSTRLVQLPDSVGHLPELRVLLANGCALTWLPETLAELSKLERGNFCDNEIEKLPLVLQEKWSDALAAGGALAVSGRDADDAEMESGEAAAAQIMLRGNPGLFEQDDDVVALTESQYGSQSMAAEWVQDSKRQRTAVAAQ